MSTNQREKATRFRMLHDGPGAFVIPNPWDLASARLLAGLGFQALATSSAASASAIGKRDGRLTRDEALAHARSIVDVTDLPVSADLEKGFGDAPEAVAETIQLAAQAGLVGCTIEDATGNPEKSLFESGLAIERIAAAAQAVKILHRSEQILVPDFLGGVQNRDLVIHYESAGQGEAVVLIHGLGANLAFWFMTIGRHLAQQYRVITYDLRGHGASSITPRGYMLPNMVEDLVQLLDHLGVQRAHIVGHSFGARVALAFTILQPQRVMSLTIADTQLRLTGRYDPSFVLLFTFLTLFVVSMALGAALTGLMRRRFSKDEWQTLLNDTTTLWDASWWKGR